MKKIYVLFLFSLCVCITPCISVYAQKQKPAPSKPIVVITQPKQTLPLTKPETPGGSKSLTNANIIQLVKGAFGESIILNAIQTNETQFDVSMNALFELKNAGVSQKIIEAMQFTVANKRQVQVPKTTDSISQQNPQPSRLDTTNKNVISDAQGLPVYGTVNDIKSFNRIYISLENAQSRERIVKALSKAPQYQIVSDPQDAQIFLEYKELSRDVTADRGDKDTRIKSQMNAVYIKNNKRVIVWSDTVEFVKLLSGGIGFRSKHNETKLTERFLKVLKE